MKRYRHRSRSGGIGLAAPAVVLACALLLVGAVTAVRAQEGVPPKPTVPEVFTLMGQFVRIA